MTLLSLQGVTRRFGGLVAVDAIDLEVAQGGVTAVIGPNGAGKTTLFNMISGFQTPNAGRIVFAGQDITARPPEEIAASGLIRTFQLVQLFQNLISLFSSHNIHKYKGWIENRPDRDRIYFFGSYQAY